MSKNTKASKEATKAQEKLAEQQARDEVAASTMQGTVAGDIWNEIKDKNIEMFALPDQKVSMHCHPVTIEPSKLYLLTNSSAVLPSLENAVGKRYVVELVDKFAVVSRVSVPLTQR